MLFFSFSICSTGCTYPYKAAKTVKFIDNVKSFIFTRPIAPVEGLASLHFHPGYNAESLNPLRLAVSCHPHRSRQCNLLLQYPTLCEILHQGGIKLFLREEAWYVGSQGWVMGNHGGAR